MIVEDPHKKKNDILIYKTKTVITPNVLIETGLWRIQVEAEASLNRLF